MGKAIKLIEVLRLFERMTERDTGVKCVSGGFAVAEVYGYDDGIYDIELKWGIQSDCQNVVHTELYTLERKALRKSVENAVLLIRENN